MKLHFKGKHHSDEAKRKMLEANKGKKFSDERFLKDVKKLGLSVDRA